MNYIQKHHNLPVGQSSWGPLSYIFTESLDKAKEIKNKDIANALDLPPIKIHCSVLAEDSIHKAIEDYESKI